MFPDDVLLPVAALRLVPNATTDLGLKLTLVAVGRWTNQTEDTLKGLACPYMEDHGRFSGGTLVVSEEHLCDSAKHALSTGPRCDLSQQRSGGLGSLGGTPPHP